MTAAAVVAFLALAYGSVVVSAHNVTFCTWHGVDCQIDNYNVSHKVRWAEERFACTLPPVNTSHGWWLGAEGGHAHGRRLLDAHAGHDMGDMGVNMGWDCDADRLDAGCKDVKVLHSMPDHTMYMNVCMADAMSYENATTGAQLWFDSVLAYTECLENATMPMDCEPEELETWTVGLMVEDPVAAAAATNLTEYIQAVNSVCQAAETEDACAYASEAAKLVGFPVSPALLNASAYSPPPMMASPPVSGAVGQSLAAVCALAAALIALCL